jgi:predicted DNA-binding transcriptional regulator AlpA
MSALAFYDEHINPVAIHGSTSEVLMSPEPFVILKKPEVCARLEISSRSLDALVSNEEFPAGVKRGKYMNWSQTAVETYLRNQYATQEKWRPGMPT